MKNHPLRIGLLLLLGVAVLIFVTSFFSSSMDGVSLLDQRIGLIRIEGVITDSGRVVDELKKYRDNTGIKAILLRIDSPGGGVVPSQEIYEEVKKIRDEGVKKVVVSMGSVAASGGYYIASASDKIVANPGTMTGSIGVIMELANVQGLAEKVGVKSVVIKSGAVKDMGSPFRDMKPEERQIFQDLLDDVHDQFIQAVAEGRGMAGEDVRKIADGRVFTGREAKDMGLVDDLGNLQDAIRLAADLSGIEGEPRVVEPKERRSWLDLLKSQWMGGLAGMQVPSYGISLKYMMSF
jgi:protease IV